MYHKTNIGDNGGKTIGEALKTNTSITVLDLSVTVFSYFSFSAF